MSALRYDHLPEQIPESAPEFKTEVRSAPLSAAPERVPVDAAPYETAPMGNPMAQLLPQILETLPNGGEMAQTLQQVSQIQALFSTQGHPGEQKNALSSLWPLLMNLPNTPSAGLQKNGQMIQLMPMLMQMMQCTSGTKGSATFNPAMLTTLMSILQTK